MRRWLAAAVLFAMLAVLSPIAGGWPARAEGAADSAIIVAGNRHTDAAMIRSYFHAAPGKSLDADALNGALKALYATGLFADVKITRDGGRVLVTVVENPTIAQIAFEGDKKLKDADLKKVVQSKEGGPLSRFLVQSDVEQMLELYRQHGYFQVQIVPNMIQVTGGALDVKSPASNDRRDAAAKPHDKGERVKLVFAIKEGEKLAVRKVAFAGNRAFPDYKLTGVVKTGKTNILSFLLDNDLYNADRIENDSDLLLQFYRAHGYADVRVRSSASYDANVGGVVVTYVLDEGPLYRLGTVDIESDLKTVDAAAVRQDLRTHSGDIYDDDAVNKTVDDLTMDLARKGEPFASVFARKDRVPPASAGGTGIVNLVYAIEPGKRIYVERIEIHGNTKTHDDVIRREFDFGEGDAYNRALIDRAERRLKALGYFRTVKIETRAGSAPDRAVLAVEVTEQDTGDFNISGGYSTSTGIMAQVSVSDRNMFGTGLSGKASVTYGQYARGLDLALTDPYFLGQRMAAGVEVFGNQTFANPNQSFDSSVYGARFSVATPLTDQLGVTWSYSIYNQAVTLDTIDGISSLPIQQAAALGAIWVSSIGSTITYSTLDNAKEPTSGLHLQTANELAGLGGAAKFAKTTEDVRYYHPIVGDLVGMVRAQGGYVAPYAGAQLPLLDNFFGGPQLVRGFAPNGFGPRDVTPGTTQDNIGGNIYWSSSAQLAAPVPGVPADANLKVALFSDVGSLWATGASNSYLSTLSPSQQIANSHAMRASIGTALIWNSPFGSLQVNYAYPVAKQPYDVTQRLNFTAGGF